MQELRRQVDHIAETGLPLLIEGESGTGKEVLARAIHARSPRRGRLFLKISCCEWHGIAPLRETLFENTFTGHHADCVPESVGTVLFDDIGELPFAVQGALSSLLEDPRTPSPGASGIQVISTTRQPLQPQLISGTFRTDLYYRLNVVSLTLPPLRERRVDILALSEYFLQQYATIHRCNPEPFNTRLIDAFLAARWPGNIRELENAVNRYVLFGSVEPIIASLQESTAGRSKAPVLDCSLKELRRTAVRECEYTAILQSLNRNQWNRRKAAQELRISYRSLLYLMDQLELPKKRAASTLRVNRA